MIAMAHQAYRLDPPLPALKQYVVSAAEATPPPRTPVLAYASAGIAEQYAAIDDWDGLQEWMKKLQAWFLPCWILLYFGSEVDVFIQIYSPNTSPCVSVPAVVE
jgi:hypothetical protein